ncbi:MAG: hypothetical protein WCE38_00785 [Burkholderiales bacterium]
MDRKQRKGQPERLTFAQALAADLTDEGVARNARRLGRWLRILGAVALAALAIGALL